MTAGHRGFQPASRTSTPHAARRRVLWRALVLPWLLAGCDPGPTNVKLVALVPPGATPLQDRGSFELGLQQCESDVLRLLGVAAGAKIELERYRVPASTPWGAVSDFYTAQLPPPWQRSSDVPEQQAGFHLRLWRRTGVQGAQRMAVALLDAQAVGTQSAEPFRMLVVASVGG